MRVSGDKDQFDRKVVVDSFADFQLLTVLPYEAEPVTGLLDTLVAPTYLRSQNNTALRRVQQNKQHPLARTNPPANRNIAYSRFVVLLKDMQSRLVLAEAQAHNLTN